MVAVEEAMEGVVSNGVNSGQMRTRNEFKTIMDHIGEPPQLTNRIARSGRVMGAGKLEEGQGQSESV